MTNEAQPDGIVLLCDLNGIVQEVQHDQLGLTDSHSLGRPFTALVHGDSLKTAFGFVEAVQSGEPAFGYGLFMRSKDDKVLLHINGYALDDQMVITGARSRVVGSQLYHRTLQSHHGRVNSVYATLSAERSTHAARESELLDQVARLQADKSALSAALEQTNAARAADPDEAPDQSQHVVELTLANSRLQAELSRCAAAAEAQRDAEATFAGIFRAGPVGMAVSARSDGRLVEVNAQLERLLDYRRGELTGQPLHKLFAPGSRSILGKVEAHLSIPHTPLETAAKLRMKDGTSRDFLAAFELTDLNGELFLLTAVMEAQAHLQSEHSVQENEQIRRELNVQAAALRQEVKLLQDDVRAYKQREQSLSEQSGKLRERVVTLEDEVARREQREKELSLNIAAYQPDVRERTLAAQVAALQASRQELTAQVATLQENAAQAEREAGEHKEREQTLTNQVTAVHRLNFRIEALHSAMEEGLKRQSADLQQQQAGLEAELTRRRQSEDELAHLAANLLESASAHEAELAGFRQREQTLIDQLTEMRADALLQEHDLKAQVDGLHEQIGTLQAELAQREQTLQSTTTSLHEQIGTLQEELAQREQTLQSTTTSLREQIGKLQEELAQREQTLRSTTTSLHDQIGKLQAELARQEQIGQSQSRLDSNEQTQNGHTFASQESTGLLERQVHERREAETTLMDRIREWRDRTSTGGDSAGTGVEREQVVLEQIDRLEQHIQASAEASQSIVNAAVALRLSQAVKDQTPPTRETPAAPDRSRLLVVDETIRARTEQELRNELGALHRQDQERIRQIASLQAQLGLRELELTERQPVPDEPMRAQTEQELRNELGVLHHQDQERIRQIANLQAQLGLRELELTERQAAPIVRANVPEAAASVEQLPVASSVEAGPIAGQVPAVAAGVETAPMVQQLADASSLAHVESTTEQLPDAALIVEASPAAELTADLPAPLENSPQAEQSSDAPLTVQSVPTLGHLPASAEVDLITQNAIASLARDTPDLQSALLLLAAEFGNQMHAEGSCLLMWDEIRQELLPATGYGIYAGAYPRLPFDKAELNISEPSLTTGHSLAAADSHGDSSTGEAGVKHGNYSTLCLPLTARGERLGVAVVTFDQSHHFTPDEIERAERFAQQVAIAIAHTRRQVDAQRRIDVLTTAQRAGLRLQPLRTREALAAEIRAVLGESFNYEYTEALLLETGTGELSTLLAGPRNPQAGTPYKFAELARRDIRTQVIRTGQSIRLTDVREGPLRDHAVLCVPLWLAGHVSGVLYLESSNTGTFTELDQQALEMVAASIAGAVENARAFDLGEQQHRQLRTLTMQLAGGEDAARRQMAHQLQIDVGQSLMMLSISLDDLPPDGPAAEGMVNIKAKVVGAQKQVDEITRNVRDVIAELHPPALDEIGLAGALRYYGGRFSERTGVPAIVNSDTWVRRLPPAVEAVLFRIAQETLTRVDRFDPIKPIRITLEDNGAIASLSITGAGVGVSPAGDDDLFRLQERAAAIGGEVRVESAPGHEPSLIVELASAA